MNKREVRGAVFAQKREWAERFESEALREMLESGRLHGGQATAVREVLRARGPALSAGRNQ